jgi:hypothetical protein
MNDSRVELTVSRFLINIVITSKLLQHGTVMDVWGLGNLAVNHQRGIHKDAQVHERKQTRCYKGIHIPFFMYSAKAKPFLISSSLRRSAFAMKARCNRVRKYW